MSKKKPRKRKRGGGGGSGTMMSMRSGFKSVVGTNKKTQVKKRNPVWNIVSWVLVAAMLATAVYFFARRYF